MDILDIPEGKLAVIDSWIVSRWPDGTFDLQPHRPEKNPFSYKGVFKDGGSQIKTHFALTEDQVRAILAQ